MTIDAPAAETTPRATRERARPLRIGIFGGYGSGNFGNDASFEALYEYLRAEIPDAQIAAVCTHPEVVAERFNVPVVEIAKRPQGLWRKLDTVLLRQPSTWINWVLCWRALANFDVILSGGTGVFDDFRDTPLGWPSKLLRWCTAARMRGVRWIFVCIGAGPIVSPISRAMMKFAGGLGERRLYRDQDSYDFMRKLGVDGPADGVWPDLAFILPAPKAERPAEAPLTVGVGIMTYRGWHATTAAYEAYVDLHVRLIKWLDDNGYGVRTIIGQAPTDLIALRDVEARLGRKLVGPREESMNSIHDAMAAIGETDMVIASRYHVQIAALKMGRPLISLGYGPKSDALMADVGLSEFCHDVENVAFDKLTRQIEAMAADRSRYAEIVREKVSALKTSLLEALKGLALARD
jgi:polysaccharide pyruvyl transferase WcaK-like protein